MDPFIVTSRNTPWALLPVFLTRDGQGEVEFVWTHCEFRRLGLASKLIELIRAKGMNMVPRRVLKEQEPFFRKRFPHGFDVYGE